MVLDPSPALPLAPVKPRRVTLALPDAASVVALDDAYSDRVRCDHPATTDGHALGQALLATARARGRGRVVVLARARLQAGLEAAGLTTEARMPGFYAGQHDCVVMGAALDPARAHLANPKEVARSSAIVARKATGVRPNLPRTRRAARADAPRLARLIGDTFAEYPTPSDDPAYLAQAIAEGTPFRCVVEGDQVVACASADLVPEARTAELTDCATRPSHRGRGLMQAVLADLMDDLRALGYPTAFTLARARVPGVNLAFKRLGFVHRGVMTRSCRIGDGLEDMNVWSRAL